MKRIRIFIAAAAVVVLGVCGVAAANYYISYDNIKPCEGSWMSSGSGSWGYVCTSPSHLYRKMVDAYDVANAINDLDDRVAALEAEVATLQAQLSGPMSPSTP
jgi:hypothetical protein